MLRRVAIGVAALVLLMAGGLAFYLRPHTSHPAAHRSLTRLTFDEGLQSGPTWSPDGRFIAYSSDRGGKFDIWVQQVTSGDPVQVTRGPGKKSQPDWSPDGKYIAYRSEAGEGGIFVVPALGDAGLERKIADFGFYPRWSPDSSRVLFQPGVVHDLRALYVVGMDESPPREVLHGFFSRQAVGDVASAAWHPDGKRISVRIAGQSPSFWTVPIDSGAALKSEINVGPLEQLGEEAAARGLFQWTEDYKFSWAPSGDAIYFEHSYQGARNFWRMSVEPKTLRALAFQRLTVGPGLDTGLALSPDGTRLAFTEESQHIRTWLFPFDATGGRIRGLGQPVTSPGLESWLPSLTRDGKLLAFTGNRSGKWEIWEESLADKHEIPILSDSYLRDGAQWAPDGKRIAYIRENTTTGQAQLVLWSTETRTEEPLTVVSEKGNPIYKVYDWSPDGKRVLTSQANPVTGASEIWELPVGAAPRAEQAGHRVLTDPKYSLFQPQYSPDGAWIAFEAAQVLPKSTESTLFVTPASGGPWVRLTDSRFWADKPRWSPDGKTIYYLSGQGGFYNVGTPFRRLYRQAPRRCL